MSYKSLMIPLFLGITFGYGAFLYNVLENFLSFSNYEIVIYSILMEIITIYYAVVVYSIVGENYD